MSKSIVNQMKTLLGMEVKFEQMKLDNGTVLEAESFEVDFDVFVLSADGEKIAAPDGEHTLEDGRVLVVKDGVILAINEAASEEEVSEEVVEEEMAVEPEPQAKKVVESTTKETHFSAEQLTELEGLLERMFERHLVSVHGSDGEEKKQEEVKEEPKAEVKAEPKKKAAKKEKMSEEIKHNPEKDVKSFKSNKKNVGYSTKQTIMSKLSKINNK